MILLFRIFILIFLFSLYYKGYSMPSYMLYQEINNLINFTNTLFIELSLPSTDRIIKNMSNWKMCPFFVDILVTHPLTGKIIKIDAEVIILVKTDDYNLLKLNQPANWHIQDLFITFYNKEQKIDIKKPKLYIGCFSGISPKLQKGMVEVLPITISTTKQPIELLVLTLYNDELYYLLADKGYVVSNIFKNKYIEAYLTDSNFKVNMASVKMTRWILMEKFVDMFNIITKNARIYNSTETNIKKKLIFGIWEFNIQKIIDSRLGLVMEIIEDHTKDEHKSINVYDTTNVKVLPLKEKFSSQQMNDIDHNWEKAYRDKNNFKRIGF